MADSTQEYEDARFLEFVVKSLVDNPDKVTINRTVDEMGVLITLDVAREDMGKIIGRSGNTAKAVRTLLRVVGMKNNARVNLKINEPEGGIRDTGANTAVAGAPEEIQEAAGEVPPQPQAADSQQSVDEVMDDFKNGN
ncbi:MAG: KH domain-containing protein [Candidatus Paceibacterota bacterium]